ncbi:MAG: polyprenyl synthetase family protein [Alphaproteobacteria bacterium]
MNKDLESALKETAADVETVLETLVPQRKDVYHTLFDAMRYSALGGGKRLRPFFVMEGAKILGVPKAEALHVAAAIEMMHCYSLIHDDLPAMDDSDLRRGRPSAHKQFDEATAILAGDALLTLAFQVLAAPATHTDPTIRTNLVTALAISSGMDGMAGGQAMDLASDGRKLSLEEVTMLQKYKTGALFTFSCTAGAILAGEGFDKEKAAFADYADAFGLLFQITDDLLDIEGDEAVTGKPVDQDPNKTTFVTHLGVEGAKTYLEELLQKCLASLQGFGAEADHLRALASYVVGRKS